MAELLGRTSDSSVLLVYYSPDAHRCLETALGEYPLSFYAVDGRAPDAADAVRRHPAKVVVIDRCADDVSITQAVRQVGQILPDSLVVTVCPGRETVDVYRSGHRIGVVLSLDEALRRYVFSWDTGLSQ